MLKEVVLGILTVAFSIAVFWLWQRAVPFIATEEFGKAGIFIYSAAALILGGSFFGMAALFIRNTRLAYAVAAVSVGSAYFFLDATRAVLIAAAASVLIAIWAVWRVRKENELSLGFDIGKLLKSGLPAYFTAVSIAISFFYFSALDEERAFAALLPRQAIEFTLKNFSGPLEYLTGLSLLRPEATAHELLEEGVLSHIIAEGIRNMLGPYARYLPAAAAIAFFLAFKTFTWLLYYLTLVVIWILVKSMTAAKILTLGKKQIEVERLTL